MPLSRGGLAHVWQRTTGGTRRTIVATSRATRRTGPEPVLGVAVLVARAEEILWVGSSGPGGNSLWNDPFNWQCTTGPCPPEGRVPTAGDTAGFIHVNGSPSDTIDLSAPLSDLPRVGGIVFGQNARHFVIGLDQLQRLQLDNGGKAVTIERLADAFNVQQIQASLALVASGPDDQQDKRLIIRNQSSVNHLSLSGNISILTFPSALVFDTAAGALTFADGIISGTKLNLIKNGAGTLQLGGANTYRSETQIFEGVLQFGKNGGIVSRIEIFPGAVFDTLARENFTLHPQQGLFFTINPAGSGVAPRLEAHHLDISQGVALQPQFRPPLDDPVYILATYDNGDRPDAVTLGFGETVTCFLFNHLDPDQSGGTAQPHTIGYWKNQNHACPLLAQAFGFVIVDGCIEAVNLLNKQDLDGQNSANDAAYIPGGAGAGGGVESGGQCRILFSGTGRSVRGRCAADADLLYRDGQLSAARVSKPGSADGPRPGSDARHIQQRAVVPAPVSRRHQGMRGEPWRLAAASRPLLAQGAGVTAMDERVTLLGTPCRLRCQRENAPPPRRPGDSHRGGGSAHPESRS